jgi:hypothetical protein
MGYTMDSEITNDNIQNFTYSQVKKWMETRPEPDTFVYPGTPIVYLYKNQTKKRRYVILSEMGITRMINDPPNPKKEADLIIFVRLFCNKHAVRCRGQFLILSDRLFHTFKLDFEISKNNKRHERLREILDSRLHRNAELE